MNAEIMRQNYYRESVRKLMCLEAARQKRTELNDLINKELRIKNGATNLLSVCHNEQSQERLKLELTFVDSNIKYLKDQLAEINCDWTIQKLKHLPEIISEEKNNMRTKNGDFDKCSNNSAFSSLSSGSQMFANSISTSILSKKNSNTIYNKNQINEQEQELAIPIHIPSNNNHIHHSSVKSTNSYSISPSSSSSSSNSTTTCSNTNTPVLVAKDSFYNNNSYFLAHLEKIMNSKLKLKIEEEFNLDDFYLKTSDIMIYLNSKETFNKLDFTIGFRNFILKHYHDDSCKYAENIQQFNLYRESSLGSSYEPSTVSVYRLYDYFNSLYSVEKRFFQDSQCDGVFFTWYDSINGIESTQKSIEYEKSSIIFNCAALYTQLAAICCDGKQNKLDEQLNLWQKAAGCLVYLSKNFSNSPTLDMSTFSVNFFTEVFMCQAYEVRCKIIFSNYSNANGKYDLNEPKNLFIIYANCAKIFSYVSAKYNLISQSLVNNQTTKNYLPEIWFYLIKIKRFYYKSLSHYYAAIAISLNNLENFHNDLEVYTLYETLHDKSRILPFCQTNFSDTKSSNLNLNEKFYSFEKNDNSFTHQSYYQKKILEQHFFYNGKIIKNEKRYNLAKVHMKEATILLEEAIRQHSFCRKFSTEDNLYALIKNLYDISLNKMMSLNNLVTSDFDEETFDLFPINFNLSDKMIIKPIEPKLQQFDYNDYFFTLGPLRVYSSENELSTPFSCILKKHPTQQNYGITLKGDCPTRVTQVEPRSYAYNSGIREGDYLIAIQDQDVKWSKHSQVVERIRSFDSIIKLTLVKVRHISREVAIFCDDNENNNIRKCSDQNQIKKPQDFSIKINKSLNESNLWNIFSNGIIPEQIVHTNSQPISKSLRIKQCLKKFSQPNSSRLSMQSFNMMNDANSLMAANAATKLCNLANSQSNLMYAYDTSTLSKNSSNSKFSMSKFKSVGNLYTSEKIQFNEEDDEISGRDGRSFWHDLKSPLANTITLGRRFKKSVMKLSIFNVFGAVEKNDNLTNEAKNSINSFINNSESAKNIQAQIHAFDADNSTYLDSFLASPIMPVFNSRPTKVRILKKQKKLKKLEKMCQKLTEGNEKLKALDNNDMMYKTI